KSKSLAGNGRLPDIFNHLWLSNLIGMGRKQRLARFVRNKLQLPIPGQSNSIPGIHEIVAPGLDYEGLLKFDRY
ncbi:hypothetical protein ACFL6U_13790, partial [Planctomycetota bacterium]